VFAIWVKKPQENAFVYSNNNFSVFGLNIPSSLNFCGEKIPSNNIEIKENLEKEFFSNSYWKSNSVVLFNKAQRWFPYIEPILKQEGVPDDFKYVAVIESHLSNIVSPAGAAGFWQMVPVSAKNYKLEVTEYIDERYHVEKSTRAACKLFKAAHDVFNNWTLAAAAYNLGIGGIQAKLKQQNTDNYYDLMLNKETGSFVYRILAYKTLFSSPSHFGIKKRKWTYVPKIPVKIFRVDTSVSDIASIANYANCTKSLIKFFNPWILQNSIPNPNGNVYEIVVPKNLKLDYSSYIKDLTGYDGLIIPEINPVISVNQKLTLDSVKTRTIHHIVKAKETIEELSSFYEVKPEQLRKWNNLPEYQQPVSGQTLNIHY
jgi:membrane-bound lytic murein transglycosylase D